MGEKTRIRRHLNQSNSFCDDLRKRAPVHPDDQCDRAAVGKRNIKAVEKSRREERTKGVRPISDSRDGAAPREPVLDSVVDVDEWAKADELVAVDALNERPRPT